MSGKKKWVFRELVGPDAKDPHGLIAYALYKVDKDKKAEELREGGASELEVKTHLKVFHDQVLGNPRCLEKYSEDATRIIDGSVKAVVKGIDDEYKSMQKKLQADHDATMGKLNRKDAKLNKQLKEIPDKIKEGIEEQLPKFVMAAAKNQESLKQVTWKERFWPWYKSGFAGYAAGVTIFVVIWGVITFMAPSGLKQQLVISAKNTVSNIFDGALASPVPVPTTSQSTEPLSNELIKPSKTVKNNI